MHMSDEHFKVSQGSVETLVRRGGKHLYHFAANLFWKRCTKCYQSFIEDITKTFWFLFSGHTVHVWFQLRPQNLNRTMGCACFPDSRFARLY